MRPTLEEERRALLEQIEASRSTYRRMLTGTPASQTETAPSDRPQIKAGFPRSKTMRWVMDHPWLIAIGVASIVWAGPGRMLAGRRSIHKKTTAAQPSASATSSKAGAIKGLAGIAVMLLQDPRRLQTASRVARIALRWMQQRRQ